MLNFCIVQESESESESINVNKPLFGYHLYIFQKYNGMESIPQTVSFVLSTLLDPPHVYGENF